MWPPTLVIPVFIAGMSAKLTRVQLRRHAGGKVLSYAPAAHVLIRPRSSLGGAGGYFADTSAAYENQALLAPIAGNQLPLAT